jgi:hypothetical protein
MAGIGLKEIARRIGVHPATVWKWSRRGRIGPPINPDSRRWKWADDESLALTISILRQSADAKHVWNTRNPDCMATLGDFAHGRRSTDSDDLLMAAMVLRIAADRHERRSAGIQSPCTRQAELVAAKMLARHLAGDLLMPEKMRGTAKRLAALAESGNATMPPTE